MSITENNSHMVFVGSEEIIWRNLLHAVTKSKVCRAHGFMSAVLRVPYREHHGLLLFGRTSKTICL